MFDGLKEKLGSFTEDVDEDIDEPDDEDADATAEEADAGADDTVGADDTAPSDAHGSADDTVPPDESDGTSSGPGTSSGHESSSGPGTSADPDVSVGAADDGDTESDDGRGLGERAKLFASGKTVVDEDDLQDHLDDLELALLASDVEMSVAEEIIDAVERSLVGETRRRLESTGSLARDALREALYDVISVGQFDLIERIRGAERPVTIVFTGVNGVGKTTSIAKLSQYLEREGLSTVMANGDTYRAGANEQLREHGEALNTEVVAHDQGSDPAAVLYDAVEYAEANDVDVVLGDTAGRLHTSEDLMSQLAKIDRVVDPELTVFVDEAVAGQDAVNRAREFDDAASIDGTVLTKADADAQGGAAISIAHVTGQPILFLGTGQGYDDLRRFDPESLVDELVPS